MDLYTLSEAAKDRYTRLTVALAWDVKARREFYDLMADFIEDSVPVHEATEEIHARYVSIGDARRHITQRILDDQRGSGGHVLGLGASLAAWVPSLEAMAIEAGERSSGPAQGLRMASKLVQVQSAIKTAVIAKLSYPGVLLVMLAGFLISIDLLLIPVFEQVMPRDKWPLAPALLGRLADMSNFLVAGFFVLIGSMLVLFATTKGSWSGPVREALDKRLAPWSVYRRMSGAILMSIFALLTEAGVPFSQVLAYLDGISSQWMRGYLAQMRAKLRQGSFSGEAMSNPLFDEEIRWKIEVYGRRSSFARALQALSDRVQQNTIERITRTATLLRGFVYVLMACMFGWVYMSFLTLSFASRSGVMMH